MGLGYLGRVRQDAAVELVITGGLLTPGDCQFADLGAMIAAIGAGSVFVPLGGRADGRAIRVDLWMSCKGLDNQTCTEQLWGVRRTDLPGFEILLEKWGTLTWTRGLDGVIGGPADHYWCDTVAVSAQGLLEARTRAEIDSQNIASGMATATVFDVGPCIGFVRNVSLVTATGAMPYSALWN
jgi:hypothetical protein